MLHLKRAFALIMVLTCSAVWTTAQDVAGAKPDPTLTLKIGNPRLKDLTMDVAVGAIMSAETGKPADFEAMIRAMGTSRFIYVGETHNSLPMHEIQFQILRALYARDRQLAIGLEMLPVTCQETLNRWSLGLLTTDEFLREVQWYVNWNFNFGYYRKILEFAKEHRLPVYALNMPREVVSKIRMQGWSALSDEQKAFIPKAPDLTNKDHRTLIKTIFEAEEIPPAMKGLNLDDMFEGLYEAQSAWDEVMAANALKGEASEGRRVLVCAGSGHVLYNLGINRRAFETGREPFKTVIAVVVPKDKKTLTVSRSIADFVFGLAEEAKPGFPTIGLGLKKFENLGNLVVDSKPMEGAASKAGFEKGDVVLSVDGKAYDDVNELRMYMARSKCGDEIKFRVLRDGQVKDVVIKFAPAPQAEAKPAEKKS